ncbi:Os06g0258800 [Oryza sativa Japonica Group]|uniref:Os06g0258800 protein n=1 Tax=Oryza sativa subsp. japonica TaxID=39947 RepID=C7J3M2_ORYSJ|nr:Os06g0258800 [Oryza sativa Japonica Group]|eukprot:NP_001174701.1 Os06g0258800 [Oryza sativa Japonica Group]
MDDPSSCNHELRLMGMRGDDKDDLEEVRVQVFGITSSPPHFDGLQLETEPDVDGTSGSDSDGGTGAPSGTDSSATNKRPRSSKVWDDFEELFESPNGAQSMLKYNADGTVRPWEYDPDYAISELVKLIAVEDLPLNFSQSPAFEEYIQNAHNPRFHAVSRQTISRDVFKYFDKSRVMLIERFKSVNSVALTSDIWSGNAKEDYLSVVAHFVNSDWQLEKRILGLVLIDVKHTAENISERVLSVVEEYGLTDKVFSITLDNASSNTKAMDFLKPKLSAYVGDLYLHQRCACHIINLIVKAGLEVFKPMLQDFRTAISFVNASNQRIALYKNWCIAKGVRLRKFDLDMDVRWNATYLMLKHLFPHKELFSLFIETHYPRENDRLLLTDLHWTIAETVLLFLEQFYDSTVILSGVYYPTSPLIMHHILEIAGHLNTYENDINFRNVVVPMKSKFLAYWSEIPFLYSFAFILDPRAKIRGFSNVLQIMSQILTSDYSTYLTEVRAALSDIFSKYESKFGAVRLQRTTPGNTAGKKKIAWGKIFGASDALGHGAGASPASGLGAGLFSRRTSATALIQAVSSNANSNASELSAYLDSDTVNQFDDDFNILNWWHEHKHTYPILSILARDVLTVSVSTISSKSAFSLTGRIIEERRRRLGLDMVQALALIKDWEQADKKLQHTAENVELIKSFENLFLDDVTRGNATGTG